MDTKKLLEKATGGQESISDESICPSALRPIIFDDPGIAWLEEHGEEEEGYQKDTGRYRLLPFLSQLGAAFEEAYIKNEAPCAVRLLDSPREVHKIESFQKTLEHLEKGTKFLWQAALWWHPEQLYGVADGIVHTSFLYRRYPHLRPTEKEPPHHVIIEFKASRKMDSSPKKAHLEHATAQTRIYSYMLGHLQNFMPRRAFIISLDTIDAPLIVDVNLKLNQPLDEGLTDLRDAFLDIRKRGAKMRPWKDEEVRLNPAIKPSQSEPWSDVKGQILEEKVRPRSLLMLPGIGPETARKMRLHGYTNIDALLSRDIDRIRFEDVDGIDVGKAKRLRAVLKANKTGKVSEIPTNLIPKRADVELYIDTEYMSLNFDFDDWPNVSGAPMIFMIGCRYRDEGQWKFMRYTAREDTAQGELAILRSLLSFFRKQGVFDPSKTVALYCWSKADDAALRRAGERHDLPQLQNLPFVDLMEIFTHGPLVLPEMWSFGLKEVAEALGQHAPYYKVTWPDGLHSGMSAQIAAISGYDDEEPLKTPEMRLIAEYLEIDCLALERILAWLRKSRQNENRKAVVDGGWYRIADTDVLHPAFHMDGAGWYRLLTAK